MIIRYNRLKYFRVVEGGYQVLFVCAEADAAKRKRWNLKAVAEMTRLTDDHSKLVSERARLE